MIALLKHPLAVLLLLMACGTHYINATSAQEALRRTETATHKRIEAPIAYGAVLVDGTPELALETPYGRILMVVSETTFSAWPDSIDSLTIILNIQTGEARPVD